MSEWQPIETAPKDGTRIAMRGYIDTHERKVQIYKNCTYDAKHESFITISGWIIVADGWMPMPASRVPHNPHHGANAAPENDDETAPICELCPRQSDVGFDASIISGWLFTWDGWLCPTCAAELNNEPPSKVIT